MSADSKAISEHFARAKGYLQRNDSSRALASFIMGLKHYTVKRIFGREKLEFDNSVYEVTQLLMRNELVQNFAPQGLPFTPGQEKQLLQQAAKVLKDLQAHLKKGDVEKTRARKLKLDQALIRGQKMLAAGSLGEAEESFQEALSLYKDEIPLFQIIGAMYIQADMPRPALPYLKQSLSLHPGDQPTLTLLVQAYEKLNEFSQALQYHRELIEVYGETPDRLLKLAELLGRSREIDAAIAAARRVLESEPNHIKAKKLLTKLAKMRQS